MTRKPKVPIEPVKGKRSLHHIVQEKVKGYIIQNNLQPGDQLPSEVELTGLLGVSRNSVREAIKGLEILDIVETRSGSGLFVGQFSFDALLDNFGYGIMFNLTELADVLEIRFHVEYGMVARTIDAVDDEQIAQLHDIIDRMQATAQVGISDAENDLLFHQVLWRNVNNRVLSKILEMFWGIFLQARQQSDLPGPADLLRTVERHRQILDALEKRDVVAIQDAMIFHYEGIKQRLEGIMAHDERTTST